MVRVERLEMSRKQKALIHLGAGELHVPGILCAKGLGLFVVTTDVRPNPPGAIHSDLHWTVSAADAGALTELALELSQSHEVVGAFSTIDLGLNSVARICQELALPGNSPDAVDACLDKSRALEVWRRNGLPVPTGRSITRSAPLTKFSDFSYPLIIKPGDSCGSQGVVTVTDLESFHAALEQAGKLSEMVIVEELVEGEHIDVNGLFIEGCFHPAGMMDRFFMDPPHHVPLWGCQPCHLGSSQQSETYQLLEHAARSLGIDHGPVKGDVIWTHRGPVLLEIAPRFHGDVSTQFLSTMTGEAHPAQSWFASLAGVDAPRMRTHARRLHAGWRALFPSKAGRIANITGVEEVLHLPCVTKLHLIKEVGQDVPEITDTRAICGFVWATAEDRCTLESVLRHASDCIEFQTHPSCQS